MPTDGQASSQRINQEDEDGGEMAEVENCLFYEEAEARTAYEDELLQCEIDQVLEELGLIDTPMKKDKSVRREMNEIDGPVSTHAFVGFAAS